MDNPLDLTGSTPLPHNQPPSSFLHRCSSSSSLPRRIPGPAGALHEAMLRRKSNAEVGLMNGEIIPTQEYIRRVVEDGNDDNDDDFTRNPWFLAIDFVLNRGLVAGDGAIGVPLSAIKSGINVHKVAQVVAIVKSCAPTALGGMMVTLKDPTDTIDASIHQGVLTHKDFGKHISIGAVMVLQKVSVFSPTRSARYLNITLNNVVKVISKDEETLSDQQCSAPRIEQLVYASEHENMSQPMPQIQSSSSERMEVIMNDLRRNAGSRMSTQSDIHMEEMETRSRIQCEKSDGTSSDHHNSASRVTQIVSNSEHLDKSQMPQIQSSISTGRTEAIISSLRQNANCGMSEQSDCLTEEMAAINSRQGDGSNDNEDDYIRKGMSEIRQNDCNERREGEVESNEDKSEKEKAKGSRENKGSEQRVREISRTSIPEWTDEQLDELFAFD